MNYPDEPGWKEGDTSRDAAKSFSDKADPLKRQVYEVLSRKELTADEVAGELRESVLAIRPRLSELRADGLIRPSGQKRLNRSGMKAHVWTKRPLSNGMKILVAGSRKFDDYSFLKEKLDHLISKLKKKPVIISGGAKGADKLAEQWAFESGLDKLIFHANWDKYGKGAGPKRNQQMVDEADVAVFFWDGKSPGTKDCIERARKKGIEVRIYGAA